MSALWHMPADLTSEPARNKLAGTMPSERQLLYRG
jgi:hypothetical protein